VDLDNVNAATLADKAAGAAFRPGDYDQAWTLIQQAREVDPGRAGLWDAHEMRLKFAESQHRPLGELLAARLSRSGFEPDDPGVALWVLHNQAVFDREIGE
jgi:hypothetical protein